MGERGGPLGVPPERLGRPGLRVFDNHGVVRVVVELSEKAPTIGVVLALAAVAVMVVAGPRRSRI